MDIHLVVREQRKKHGLSQTELAVIADVSLPSITRLEAGKSTIRLDVVTKVARALGLALTLTPVVEVKNEQD